MTIQSVIKDSTRVYFGENMPERYLKDAYLGYTTNIFAVVLPKTKEEIIQLVCYANQEDLAIIVRGGATGLTGATSPVKGELVLDLTLMDRILDFDLETLTLTVEPGVRLETIQKFVNSKGYFYPPDPGAKNSTIGGNIATNAGGMRAVKYGVTRDYVRTMEVVLASGEVLNLGSLAIKNSSGFDLKNLFIGSEGTLGITVRVQLKIVPQPKFSQSVIVAFHSLKDATDAVLTIIRDGIDVTALEFFEKDAIQMSADHYQLSFPSQKGQSYLLITFDGQNLETIEQRIKRLETVMKPHQPVEILRLDTPLLESTAWKLRDKIMGAVVAVSEQEPLDLSVPINHIADLFQFTKELEKKSGLRFVCFGHAGDGNVHACVLRDSLNDEDWKNQLEKVLTELYGKVKELNGLPSAEHGIGLAKKSYFEKMMDPVYLDYMKKIKTIFDPENRLNPTKLI